MESVEIVRGVGPWNQVGKKERQIQQQNALTKRVSQSGLDQGCYIYGGRTVIGISGSLIWSKTLTELIFNPCGEFR